MSMGRQVRFTAARSRLAIDLGEATGQAFPL